MTKRAMKFNQPRVSIGMPVYNGEKYIEATIDSILSQTYTDFEFIISDNASTDKTQEICLGFQARDPRVHYHRNSINLGAAPNYNHVFELSSSEYFKWADYDDLIAPEFLSKCIEVMDRDPEIVLCFPLSRIINENGEILNDWQYKSDTSSHEPQIRFRNLLEKPEMAYQISGLMRSSAIRRTSLHGSYPSSDLVFLSELTLCGKFHELPEYIFFPRSHPDQSTKGSLTVERNRVSFFNTANEGKILLPKWMLLRGYLDAIRKSPLKTSSKLFCDRQMIRWIFKPDHFRALGKDILLAIQKSIVRTLVRSKAKNQQA